MHKCVGKPENRGNRENAARFSLVSLGSACQHARPRLSSKSDNIEKTGEGVQFGRILPLKRHPQLLNAASKAEESERPRRVRCACTN
eukprot:1185311-Prorocentrum_minimum.AAC.2